MKKFKMKRSYLALPYAVWLTIFFFVPMLFILFYAFMTKEAPQEFTFKHITAVFSSTYVQGFLRSIFYGFLVTLICLILGYPVAYVLSQKRFKLGGIVVVLFILPMWINFLIRTLALKSLFYSLGIALGKGTAIAGMVYDFLPFMILPIYTTLLKIDKNLIEASEDLGAPPFTVILKTVLPLSVPGIISGCLMVFMPSMSTYAISDTLSGGNFPLIGTLIRLNYNNNWGLSSAIAIIMLIFIFISMLISYKFNDKEELKGGGLW
ncbi:MAG: ABC transporter permease [Clostridiales bacterium]|jgi:spermidine/putrescine transport system permease protein|nr:ABC transporter permease [Clostridiales bacterium]